MGFLTIVVAGEGQSETRLFPEFGPGKIWLANPDEWAWRWKRGGGLYLITLGSQVIAVWAGSVEDAVEGAAEFAVDRGWHGLVLPHAEVEAEGGGLAANFDEEIDDSYYYTESGYIPSDEWWVEGPLTLTSGLNLAFVFVSIVHSTMRGEDYIDSYDREYAEALVAGLTKTKGELQKKYGKLFQTAPPSVQVEADHLMMQAKKNRSERRPRRRRRGRAEKA